MKKTVQQHTFSVELNSKSSLVLDIPRGTDSPVLIEGTLGEAVQARLVEDAILEVSGPQGILRIDLSTEEWDHLCQRRVADYD
jgi:hypothetical protein